MPHADQVGTYSGHDRIEPFGISEKDEVSFLCVKEDGAPPEVVEDFLLKVDRSPQWGAVDTDSRYDDGLPATSTLPSDTRAIGLQSIADSWNEPAPPPTIRRRVSSSTTCAISICRPPSQDA